MKQIILFNKPYGIVSQFSGEDLTETLANYISIPGFYPAGRLDKKSEGLLLLTNNGVLQHQLTEPKRNKYKYYWVQVEGQPEDFELDPLRQGLVLSEFKCLPAKASIITAPTVWDRNPPIRFRKSVSDSWIEIAIQEGKNHQIRRMTAAIGYPTLRLIRHTVDCYQLGDLQPGEWKILEVT